MSRLHSTLKRVDFAESSKQCETAALRVTLTHKGQYTPSLPLEDIRKFGIFVDAFKGYIKEILALMS